MKRLEEQVERQELTDDQVLAYLHRHPDFFIHHAREAQTLRVSHPVRGCVSLVEWQLARQRQRITYLEEEIHLLTEQASRNEALFNQLLQLQLTLSSATSLQDLLDQLNRWARQLGLAGASIRLFVDRWRIGAPSDFTHLALNRTLFEPLRIHRLGDRAHYLGTLNGPELLFLMPQARHVGSVALSLLGKQGDLGLLIFSSRDSHHYQEGMGTDLLAHLATLLPLLLARWIERL
ncbi:MULTISPECIES: DUF484 domain-containing protein [Dickeya]|uniref:DUF484 domain-containing protein n=1 Tax=Dickeya aquatica TaxID=1401087 RepID=A0A375AFX9_9GAMM|nr:MULTISPECIES: DUF484 domain-containing protein [Dickeya]SLM64965.1 Protein of unknown function DUF484 [Dickeya aquatica]